MNDSRTADPATERAIVSVVLPTRNRAHLLARAIGSVRAQTFSDWELIVVDDASTDRTPAVIAECRGSDPRIRGVAVPRPHGVAEARNRGIARARGRFVAFLDDDDEWLPGKLELQLREFARRGDDVGLVYCRSTYVETSGRERLLPTCDVSDGGARATLLRQNFLVTPAVLARRELFDLVGGFDSRMSWLEDWDMWLRLAAATRFGFVDRPLVRVHQTPGSLSTRVDELERSALLFLEKREREAALTRRERAAVRFALGRDLVSKGIMREGRKLLRRSLAVWPWSPWRMGVALAALFGHRAYRLASGVYVEFLARTKAGSGAVPAPDGSSAREGRRG
ncbi:MAG TPA: glycosyltransferase family A protein [Longimicrobiales bacterium]